MIIKKCDKCGTEIREYPQTNVIFPKYFIRKCVSGLQYFDVNLCTDCEEKFTEWLDVNNEEEINNKIAELKAENEHLRNILKLNESFADAIALTVKNDIDYQEEQSHWFRNLVKKVFRKR